MGSGLTPAGGLVADVSRIAVLRANSLGDFVAVLPALAALRAAYPPARITVLGDTWHSALLDGRPGPWDEVVTVPAYPGLRGQSGGPADTEETRAFFAGQRRIGYDLAVQLHGGGRNSNPFVASLGARVTVGARDTDAPALDRWTRYAGLQHEVLRWLEVVALVGAVPVLLEPTLAVTDRDRRQAGVLPPAGRPLVLLHAGANDARRRWSPPRFAAVGRALIGDGCSVALVGGADDVALSRAIAAELPGEVSDLTGRLSLPGLVGVSAAASLMVANDSGPRHVAAAVGTATVGVFWGGNALTSAPLTRRRHRVTVAFGDRCPVCGDDQRGGRCRHEESWVDGVTPAEVLAAARDLLAG